VLANVSGRSLTEAAFAPIWQAIDDRVLPVLVHPTDPPGVDMMDMTKFDLSWSVGFMFDTTLAITRMIFEGFFDRYPNMTVIAVHVGALQYFISVVGADRVMLGTDWPYWVHDTKGAFANTACLPEDQMQKVRGDNARRVSGL